MTSLPRISSFYRQNSGGSKLTWYTWYTMPSHSTTGAWTSSSFPSLWMHHPNIPARTFNTCQETVLPVQCGSPPAFRERCRKLSAWKLVPFWPSREAKAGSLARRAQAPPARSVSECSSDGVGALEVDFSHSSHCTCACTMDQPWSISVGFLGD